MIKDVGYERDTRTDLKRKDEEKTKPEVYSMVAKVKSRHLKKNNSRQL
tara:strand:- start:3562 stop:3705 length:144 start_codon:yes stop_codon:yes gene_type:complete